VRRAEARERGDEEDVAGRVDLARERFAFGRIREHPEAVSEPLDRGAADEDRPLERISARCCGRAQESGGRRSPQVTDVDEDEATGAVRRLRLARVEARVAEERRLLIAGDSRDRQRRAEEVGLRDHLGRADDPRQKRPVDTEQLEELGVPIERVEVEQHRA
jgi:hypothetical protein